ncbi:MAG: YolD-like protein [Paenibacillus sp.]|nr:YolD-like protein [Paenibacillus sp.]
MSKVPVECMAVDSSTAARSSARRMPDLDDRQYEENIRSLAVALFTESEAIVTVWGDEEEQTIQGRITKLDKERKRIKIENEWEYSWIDFANVADIRLLLD